MARTPTENNLARYIFLKGFESVFFFNLYDS